MLNWIRSAATGAILLATAPALAEGDAKNGERVFIEVCAPCHFEFKANGNHVGPNLSSVIGREAGTFPGYKYSAAMKAASLVWSEDRLLEYLIAPKQMIPGIIMGFDGFKDDDKRRRDVVAYIKSQQGK